MAVQSDLSFGSWLRVRRKALDLTQFDLAERVGCAESTIQRIEAGDRRPSRQVAGLLAEVLAIPPTERDAFVLFARTDSPAPAAPSPAAAEAALPLQVSSELPASPSSVAPVPAPLSPLLGREAEFRAAYSLLNGTHGRLLTLTGPPGVGKTRLAVALASALASEFPEGACFVPLAPLADPALLADHVARSLGLQDSAGGPPGARLGAYLRSRRLLLVLDNFEQLVAAAPRVAEWLSAAPGLRVLVTSQAALGLRGERRFPVPPLPVPPNADAQPGVLLDYPSVALFVERAQEVDPTFQLTPDNGGTVGALCMWLEGVPLAIELAAARAGRLSPQEVKTGLQRRLDLSAPGLRDLPVHQQTLRAAIAWSYSLLAPDEQKLFRRMAVAAGGATTEALDAICNAYCDLQAGLHPALEALLEHSLVTRSATPGIKARFGMLETIREYAEELLAASDEQVELRRLHAEYYMALAEVAQPHLRGAEQPVWLGLLALEHDNLRAAHDWLFQTGADESCLRLAGALGDFWDLRGHWSEGLARIEPVLARSTTAVQTPTRARALQVMGTLYGDLGNIDLATRALEQSVGLWREVGDEKGLAGALADWGYWLLFARPYVEDVVLPKLHESLQRYRNVGDTPGAAFVLLVLADQASMRSDAAHARALLEESNDLFEQTGDAWGIAWSLSRLAELTAQQGDLAAATRMCERSLQIFRELDVKEGEGNVLGCLALLACKEGDLTTATALCERLTTLQRELGNSMMLAVSLINLGHLSRLQGDSKAALASYREARSLIDQGNGFGPYYRYLIRGLLAQVQSQHDKALAAFEECLGAAEEQLQDRARAKHRAVCLVATTTSLLAQGQVAEAATILASLSSTPPDVSMSRLTYSLDYARNLATTHALLGANSPSRVSRP